MTRKHWTWALALLAISCSSARSAAGPEPNPSPAAKQLGKLSGIHAKAAEKDDGHEEYELRAYRVADLLTPTPNYPYPGDNLPSVGPLGTFRWPYTAGMGGWGGGVGGGMGGMGGGGMGGGMFQVIADESRESGGEAGDRLQSSQPFFRNVDDLIRAIRSLVDPASWQDVGGQGDTAYFGGLLLVRQTKENHKKIDDLLETIRSQGGTAQTVTVDALWLLLDSDQLAQLLGADSAKPTGRSPLTVDPAALEKLAREVQTPGYRGRITCFSGQTVHLASGSRRSVVVGAVPVVGSAPAYQPVMACPNLGVVLQVTPTVLFGREEAILDVQSTVTKWDTPDPPVQIGSHYPSTRRILNVPGEVEETPSGTASIEVDRLNIAAHQLATTLRLPLGKPVLVGGLTLEPTENVSRQQTQRDGKQLYVVIRISAADPD